MSEHPPYLSELPSFIPLPTDPAALTVEHVRMLFTPEQHKELVEWLLELARRNAGAEHEETLYHGRQ